MFPLLICFVSGNEIVNFYSILYFVAIFILFRNVTFDYNIVLMGINY